MQKIEDWRIKNKAEVYTVSASKEEANKAYFDIITRVQNGEREIETDQYRVKVLVPLPGSRPDWDENDNHGFACNIACRVYDGMCYPAGIFE